MVIERNAPGFVHDLALAFQQHFRTRHDVGLHNGVFFIAQRGVLHEDFGGDHDFADIVHDGSRTDNVHLVFGHAHMLRQDAAVFRHTLHVLADLTRFVFADLRVLQHDFLLQVKFFIILLFHDVALLEDVGDTVKHHADEDVNQVNIPADFDIIEKSDDPLRRDRHHRKQHEQDSHNAHDRDVTAGEGGFFQIEPEENQRRERRDQQQQHRRHHLIDPAERGIGHIAADKIMICLRNHIDCRTQQHQRRNGHGYADEQTDAVNLAVDAYRAVGKLFLGFLGFLPRLARRVGVLFRLFGSPSFCLAFLAGSLHSLHGHFFSGVILGFLGLFVLYGLRYGIGLIGLFLCLIGTNHPSHLSSSLRFRNYVIDAPSAGLFLCRRGSSGLFLALALGGEIRNPFDNIAAPQSHEESQHQPRQHIARIMHLKVQP